MTTPARQNFFILLDLNPDTLWNQAAFEVALKAKQNEWSRQGSNVGAKALSAKKNLAFIPEIKRVMNDEALRTAEAQAARSQRVAANKVQREKFERELAFLNAKEYIVQTELDAFIVDYKSLLSDKEIRARVTVPVRPLGSATTTTMAPQLDAAEAKAIEEKLALLGIPNLYVLLGRPPGTSSVELVRAAVQLYADTINRQPKTAEVTAQADLAGRAKDIFGSPNKKARYDETLRQHSLNLLLKELESSMKRSVDKEVHERQVQNFLIEARKAGWTNEEALTRLKEFARTHNWYLHLPPPPSGPPVLRCGNCHEENTAASNFCRKCKLELMVSCPQCKKVVASDDSACGACGFPVGNRYWFDILLEQAESTQDLQKVEEILREAKSLWNLAPPEKRAERLSRLQKQVEQQHREQRHTLEQAQQLIDKRQLFAARALLQQHGQAMAGSDKVQLQHIAEGIRQARIYLDKAQAVGVDHEQQIAYCRQSIQVCADFKEAQAFLSTIPPSPPSNLRATVSGNVVHLNWTPSSTSGVKYKVLRKISARPNSADDGTVLSIVTGHSYDDVGPEMGLPMYYAIFSLLEAIPSPTGTMLTQPKLLTCDVENVTASVDDKRVQLSWQTPPNAHMVLIVRKERTPSRDIHDGQSIAKCDRTQSRCIDQNVRNETTYYYSFYCQFKNHEGHLITSPGISVKAIPETPPACITELDIDENEQEGLGEHEIHISWSAPGKGNVIILKSTQSLNMYNGEVLAEAQLARFGERIESHGTTLVDRGIGNIVVYYTPVVIFQKMAYIGVSHRYLHVDNVTQVKQQNLGNAIRLKWRWPEQCKEVRILLSTYNWPRPMVPDIQEFRVTRGEYERLGYYDIKGRQDYEHYVVISALITQGDEEIAAQGVRIMARQMQRIVVTYEIKRPTFFSKNFVLLINTRTPGTLPAMHLVVKSDVLPFTKEDGSLLQRIAAVSVEDKAVEVKLTKRHFASGALCKLFLEDESMYDVIDIYHPDENKLKLG